MRDLIGQVFGEWRVLARHEHDGPKSMWLCACSCGKQRPVYETHLIRGQSNSCGRSHGKLPKTTPGYSSWKSMLCRCLYQTHPAYHRYGGRGITVCERWREFPAFFADMGPRPDGMTLERIDSDGNYEPANCKWATHQEQQNNTRTNRFLDVEGERLTIAQLARKQGINYETLYARLKKVGVI
jgi:hypothetical protein